jgi:hypothetical protein
MIKSIGGHGLVSRIRRSDPHDRVISSLRKPTISGRTSQEFGPFPLRKPKSRHRLNSDAGKVLQKNHRRNGNERN